MGVMLSKRWLGRAIAVISTILISCIKKLSSQLHGQVVVAKLFRGVARGVKKGDGTLEIFVSSERPCYCPCSTAQIV